MIKNGQMKRYKESLAKTSAPILLSQMTQGYMLAVNDMTMHQVACSLYQTKDGGHSWKKVDMDAVDSEHSVTYEFEFVS